MARAASAAPISRPKSILARRRSTALARVARDVATADTPRGADAVRPLRPPLFGDASITSPFGYRADPFLGRLPCIPASISLRAMARKSGRPAPDALCMPDRWPDMESWSRSIMATGSRPVTRTCRRRWSRRARRSPKERSSDAGLERPLDRTAFALRGSRRRRTCRPRALSARRRRTHGRGIGRFPRRAANQSGMDVLIFRVGPL